MRNRRIAGRIQDRPYRRLTPPAEPRRSKRDLRWLLRIDGYEMRLLRTAIVDLRGMIDTDAATRSLGHCAERSRLGSLTSKSGSNGDLLRGNLLITDGRLWCAVHPKLQRARHRRPWPAI